MMQHDEAIWQIIGYTFCSFKAKYENIFFFFNIHLLSFWIFCFLFFVFDQSDLKKKKKYSNILMIFLFDHFLLERARKLFVETNII
jgi:hypothetical protein